MIVLMAEPAAFVLGIWAVVQTFATWSLGRRVKKLERERETRP